MNAFSMSLGGAMTTNTFFWRVVAAMLVLAAPSLSFAQNGGFGGGFGPPLKVVPPPKQFASSEEHYKYLLEQAKGGTKQTLATGAALGRALGPRATRTSRRSSTAGRLQGQGSRRRADARVREGLQGALAPADRGRPGELRPARPLRAARPAALPARAVHARVHQPAERVVPDQRLRAVDPPRAIGKEHSNVYGTHSWYGDTIGFWDGDKLVLNTKYLYPADFTRWSPMTSNAFETVEIWQLKKYDGGIERLEVQATFYDKYVFVKPVSAVYAFRHATELAKADYRVNHWECEQTSNAYLDDKGVTNFHLPGEEGFNDGRGATMFPELPGQTRDPIYNTTLPTADARRARSRRLRQRSQVMKRLFAICRPRPRPRCSWRRPWKRTTRSRCSTARRRW